MPPLPPIPTDRRRLYLFSFLTVLTFVVLAITTPRLLKPPPLHKLTSHLSHLSRQNPITHYQLPHWDDHSRIRFSVDEREARQQAFPTLLNHLTVANAPSPFNQVSVVSGWLDRRPELVGRAPEVVMVGTMEGRPWLKMPEAVYELDEGVDGLECWVSVERAGRRAKSFKAKVTMVGPRDPHEDVKDWAVTMFSCPVPFGGDDDLANTDWDSAEIFATLSLPNLPPPVESFVRANALPPVDPAHHKTGHGPAAVCLAPLTGDLYAPHLRAFIAHYRALGFAQFYPYLLNPGPATLAVLRELAQEDGISPIRWGLPKAWDAETRLYQRSYRAFEVEVDQWRLPGLEMLPPEQEFRLGTSRYRDADVPVWYYGQSAAQQDCTFRAMASGARWVASVDFDEWLVLVPGAASGSETRPWPAPSRLPEPDEVSSILGDFFRELPVTPWYPHALEPSTRNHLGLRWERPAENSRVLSSAYLFKSAFGCVTCQPTAASERGRLEGWSEGALPLVLGASVRHQPWLPEGVRAKTIYDPWAWWTIGIHMPGISFAEYGATHSFCSASRHAVEPDPDEVHCAQTLVDIFGIDAVVVTEYDPSNVRAASKSTQHRPASGAMLHLRVPHHEHPGGAGWVTDEPSLSAVQGGGPLGRGNATVSFSFEALARVPLPQWASQYNVKADIGDVLGDDYELDLVEDWTAWEVMHPALAQALKLMREGERRRAQGRVRGWSAFGGVVLVAVLGGVWWRARRAVVRRRQPAAVWSMAEMRDGGGTSSGTGVESPLLVGRRGSRFRDGGGGDGVALEMRDRRQ